MTLYSEEEQVILKNPKHLKCPKCGHEEDIYAAAAIPKGDGTYTLWFGSEADFCTKCDALWGRNIEPDYSDETDKRVDYLHRSSSRMKASLSLKNRGKVWWAFMRKETWIHLKRSVELWWHVSRKRHQKGGDV